MQSRAVLIIDNCSYELHRSLTKQIKGSQVSLLTVEYDIRDDIPESTQVVRLEPSSNKAIETLLQQRFPHIGQVNRQTIAEFSGGNARIAIALANTLKVGESLSALRDQDLFDRLFRQRHVESNPLRKSAEVCSLVYSFDGADTAPDSSELSLLADLVGQPIRELYRDIAELQRRGLVQARSVWRAVLPQAIANRLATHALSNLPTKDIIAAFLDSGSERLISSFTRRLGYLHDCEPAVAIVKRWQEPDGWLGEANCNLNALGFTVVKNISPVAPEATLSMLERCVSSNEGLGRLHNREYARLLWHLAYETDLFQRCARLLWRLALRENPKDNNSDSARSTLEQLFQRGLSGTQAPPETRVAIIEELVGSSRREEQELGVRLLEVALETRPLMSLRDPQFGARPRDFGYWPNTNEALADWYEVFLRVGAETALSEKPVAIEAKRAIAASLRGLWSVGVNVNQGLLDKVEETIIQIHDQEPWNDGWISIKKTIYYDGEGMADEALSRLRRLSQLLRPTSLLQQARVYALAGDHSLYDLDEDFDKEEGHLENLTRMQDKTRSIAMEVVQDETVFNELLPELVSHRNERLFAFGAGLAAGSNDREAIWSTLRKQFAETPPENRQLRVMRGYLSYCGTNDPALYHSILDSLVTDEVLGPWFPIFQTVVTIDQRGVERLHHALDKGTANVFSFGELAYGRRHESISDDDFAALLGKLLAKEGGESVVMDLLSMRFHKEKGESVEHSRELIAVAQQVLLQYSYEQDVIGGEDFDYELAQIAGASLIGPAGTAPAKKLCQLLATGLLDYRIHGIQYPRLLSELANIQPQVILDVFFGQERTIDMRSRYGDDERVTHPVNQMPVDVVIAWCQQAPETRFPRIASAVQSYFKPEKSSGLSWHPVVLAILDNAPDLETVLPQLLHDIRPMAWGDSRADAMEERLVLFTKLHDHPNPTVRDWSLTQWKDLSESIDEERERELEAKQKRFERFE